MSAPFYSYRKTQYINGKLNWMADAADNYETPAQAITAARQMARYWADQYKNGSVEETEFGAKMYGLTESGNRVLVVYTLR